MTGSVYGRQVRDHDEQAADRQLAAQYVKPADDDDESRAGERDGRHNQPEERLLPREPEARGHRLVASFAETSELVRLAREALHHLDTRKNLTCARSAWIPAP